MINEQVICDVICRDKLTHHLPFLPNFIDLPSHPPSFAPASHQTKVSWRLSKTMPTFKKIHPRPHNEWSGVIGLSTGSLHWMFCWMVLVWTQCHFVSWWVRLYYFGAGPYWIHREKVMWTLHGDLWNHRKSYSKVGSLRMREGCVNKPTFRKFTQYRTTNGVGSTCNANRHAWSKENWWCFCIEVFSSVQCRVETR